jgi:hypothetical protein
MLFYYYFELNLWLYTTFFLLYFVCFQYKNTKPTTQLPLINYTIPTTTPAMKKKIEKTLKKRQAGNWTLTSCPLRTAWPKKIFKYTTIHSIYRIDKK